jgi:hypothetical protein
MPSESSRDDRTYGFHDIARELATVTIGNGVLLMLVIWISDVPFAVFFWLMVLSVSFVVLRGLFRMLNDVNK